MATRLNKRQTESARDLIQTHRIVQELQKYLNGERDMTATQVRAAEVLLNRSMPCLSSVTWSADTPTDLPILKIVPADDSAAA